jgi:hypothetical protein
MNRQGIILIFIVAVIFLIVLVGVYLPQQDALRKLNATITAEKEEIDQLERYIPDHRLEAGRLAELIKEAEDLRSPVARVYDISTATEEMVRLCRVSGGITVDSITEEGEGRIGKDGVRKWLIRLHLRSSYHDFARLLHRFNDADLPLAVEAFSITNQENQFPRSQIELIVGACIFEQEDKGLSQ